MTNEEQVRIDPRSSTRHERPEALAPDGAYTAGDAGLPVAQIVGRVVRIAPERGARLTGRAVRESPGPSTRVIGCVVRHASDPGARVVGRVVREAVAGS